MQVTSYPAAVRRAEHILSSFYVERARQILKAEGISDEQIAEGGRRLRIRRQVEGILEGTFGNPAYGAWPAHASQTRGDLYKEHGYER